MRKRFGVGDMIPLLSAIALCLLLAGCEGLGGTAQSTVGNVPVSTATSQLKAPPTNTPTLTSTATNHPTLTPTRTLTLTPTPSLTKPSFGDVVPPMAAGFDAARAEGWAAHTEPKSQISFSCPDDWHVEKDPQCFSSVGCAWILQSDSVGMYLQPVSGGSRGAPVAGRNDVSELAALLLHVSDTYQEANAGSFRLVAAYVVQDDSRKAYVIETVLNEDGSGEGPLFYALDIIVIPAEGRPIYINYFHDNADSIDAAEYLDLERFLWTLSAPAPSA